MTTKNLCRSPKCTKRAILRDKWCRKHGEQLERVQAELEREMERLRKGKSISRRCRAPGCDEYRQRGSGYCALHEDMEVIE